MLVLLVPVTVGSIPVASLGFAPTVSISLDNNQVSHFFSFQDPWVLQKAKISHSVPGNDSVNNKHVGKKASECSTGLVCYLCYEA